MATKVVSTRPKYLDMTTAAIDSLGEKGGSSRQAILRYILEHYETVSNEKLVNNHLKMALKRGVENGDLKQSTGTGASGSFKLGEVAKAKAKAEAKAEAKTKVDKVVKVKTVKPKTDKKPKEKVKPAKLEKKTKGVKEVVKKTATSLKSKPVTTPKKSKTVAKSTKSKVAAALKTPKRTLSAAKTKTPKAENISKKVDIKTPKTKTTKKPPTKSKKKSL